MRFFSYGRKSVFSDKSDSIDNQFRMSREYCESKFSGQVDSWQQFSDEDFTGANTSRPDLQRMLSFIKGGFCDVLVVYQLDRLSRDVRDFANIYALLEEHGVMSTGISIARATRMYSTGIGVPNTAGQWTSPYMVTTNVSSCISSPPLRPLMAYLPRCTTRDGRRTALSSVRIR